MKIKIKLKLIGSLFFLTNCGTASLASNISSMQVPPELVTQLMGQLGPTFTAGASRNKIEIEGEYILDLDILHVDELKLNAGSKIILTGASQKYIIAKKITVTTNILRPNPSITWQREPAESRIPIPAGKASAGESGAINGDGQTGASGLTGNSGFHGRSAPNLILIVSEISGGKIKVDLGGQAGGKGGVGQIGGDGGFGRPGRSGWNGLFACGAESSPGNRGGDGGRGGRGGEGGRGGNAGSIAVLRPADAVWNVPEFFDVDLSGGQGGLGGAPGKGGAAGQAGNGGAAAGKCNRPAHAGTPGQPGPEGETGVVGVGGIDGEFRAGVLTPENSSAARLTTN
jgi:hypothetical protein